MVLADMHLPFSWPTVRLWLTSFAIGILFALLFRAVGGERAIPQALMALSIFFLVGTALVSVVVYADLKAVYSLPGQRRRNLAGALVIVWLTYTLVGGLFGYGLDVVGVDSTRYLPWVVFLGLELMAVYVVIASWFRLRKHVLE
jgi:hypothetical protein